MKNIKENSPPKSIAKLLRLLPHVKNITEKQHKLKGTIVLLNEKTRRKYLIFKSGYAKAVDADKSRHCNTDFINAWISDWKTCYSYSKSLLISILYDYIVFHDICSRYVSDYSVDRKGEEEKVWSSLAGKYIPKSQSIFY